MRGRGRKRKNIFKLGRRGRRGRVAFDDRWRRIPMMAAEALPDTVPDTRSSEDISQSRFSNMEDEDNTLTPHRAAHVTLDEMGTGWENLSSPKDLHVGCGISGRGHITSVTNAETNGNGRGQVEETRGIEDSEAHACITEEREVDINREGDRSLYAHDLHEMPFSDEPQVFDTVEAFAALGEFTLNNPSGSTSGNVTSGSGNHQPECAALTEGMDADGLQLSDDDAQFLNDREIIKAWKKLSSWQNILALAVVNGTVKYSVKEYQVFQNCMNALLRKFEPRGDKMPSYSTVSQTLLPLLKKWGLPKTTECTSVVDNSKSGARPNVRSNRSSAYTVVMPSTWSRMDVQCPNSWKILKESAVTVEGSFRGYAFDNIESVPMVTRRDDVLDVLLQYVPQNFDVLGSSCGLLRAPRRPPRTLKLTLRDYPSLPEELCAALRVSVDPSGNTRNVTVKTIQVFLVGSSYSCPADVLTFGEEMGERRMRYEHIASLLRKNWRDMWREGDVCTLLETSTNLPYYAVLAHHQAEPGRMSSRIQLICIPYSRFVGISYRSMHTTHVLSVRDVELAEVCMEPDPPLSGNAIVSTFGKLQNGMRYYVDRILLYSDGFSQYGFKQGSAGGVYCVSLNYPPKHRRSRKRVRVLTLTEPGVSTSEGLRSVISDLVTCATEGVRTTNSDGEVMKVFIEVVGFVGDYHEVGHILDILGPTAKAPCHLCSFPRFAGHQSVASSYGYSTEIHSENACFARTAARTEALRKCNQDDACLTRLGLNDDEKTQHKNSPLIQFYRELKEALSKIEIPLTDRNVPVVNPAIDPYRSTLVAPDHLLAGIAINEMNHAFKCIPSVRFRKQLDCLVCHMLRKNGLLLETTLSNSKTNKLHTTSISNTFCSFLMFVPVYLEMTTSICGGREDHDIEIDTNLEHHLIASNENISLLHKLISRTYWYPRKNVDEPDTIKAFNDDDGIAFISKSQQICNTYVKNCNQICRPVAGKELDKPNLHRLLELYKHSLPAMGHIRHFAELLFECAHQPLKQSMGGSNCKQSHIQAVAHSLFDDWKSRMAANFSMYQRQRDVNSVTALEDGIKSVANLLIGRNPRVSRVVQQDSTFRKRIHGLLENEVLRGVFRGTSEITLAGITDKQWVLLNKKPCDESHPDTCAIIKNFVLSRITSDPEFYSVAKRFGIDIGSSSASTSHSRVHDTLYRECVLRAVTIDSENPFMLLADSTDSEDHNTLCHTSYFVVIHLFKLVDRSQNVCNDDRTFATVRRCVVTDAGLLQIDSTTEEQIILLSVGVRRVALVHACASDPSLHCIRNDAEQPHCAASMLGGNRFHFFGRTEGYPPRMA